MARYRCGAVRISLGQVGMARGCADLAQSPVREASGGVGLHGRPAAAVCILRSGVADPASMLGLVLGRRRRAVAHRPARSGHVQAGSWLRRVVGEVRGCGCCSCVRVGHDLYLPDGGGARLLLDGGGRLHPRLDAGCRTRYGLCRPVVEEEGWWSCTVVVCSPDGGYAWSSGGTGRPRPTACEWVHRVKAWPMLAGRRLPRASLFSLEASFGFFTAYAHGSCSSGESPHPDAGSGDGVVFSVVPLLRRRLEALDPLWCFL
ncbi:uncharacterized protein LOC123440230 [Hordeum vulgare subsp. vulgare]|uniref:Predicted protein n=1 Tax=Hordeum vulgare subsp. vulgare TaxID=112509 RepID=F2EFH5_HORVV|nr:uncharacterized protein LOC123440230 [Hordeum vulgare subsp. vulgare]BAK06097.1 predicted protein [Hordeum vulgare subsp. vulgare]